jgi:hypothetical protein
MRPAPPGPGSRSPAAPWGIGIPPLSDNPVPARATLLAELADDLERWHRKFPNVPAYGRMPGRAHGLAAALLAGSGGQRLLYHSGCPLLIVHSGPRD